MLTYQQEVQEGIKKYTDSVTEENYQKQLSQLSLTAAVEAGLLDLYEVTQTLKQKSITLTVKQQEQLANSVLVMVFTLDQLIKDQLSWPAAHEATQQLHSDVWHELKPLLSDKFVINLTADLLHHAADRGTHTYGQKLEYTLPTQVRRDHLGNMRYHTFSSFKLAVASLKGVKAKKSKPASPNTKLTAFTMSITATHLQLLKNALTHYLENGDKQRRINDNRRMKATMLNALAETYLSLHHDKTLTNNDHHLILQKIELINNELTQQTTWLDRLRGNRLGHILNKQLTPLRKINHTMQSSSRFLSAKGTEQLSNKLEFTQINTQRSRSSSQTDSLNHALLCSKIEAEQITKQARAHIKAHHPDITTDVLEQLLAQQPLLSYMESLQSELEKANTRHLSDEKRVEFYSIMYAHLIEANIFKSKSFDRKSAIEQAYQLINKRQASAFDTFINTLPAQGEETLKVQQQGQHARQSTQQLHLISIRYQLAAIEIKHKLTTIHKPNLSNLISDIDASTHEERAAKQLALLEKLILTHKDIYKYKADNNAQAVIYAAQETALASILALEGIQDHAIAGITQQIKQLAANFNQLSFIKSREFKALRDSLSKLNRLSKNYKLTSLVTDWDAVIHEVSPRYIKLKTVFDELTEAERRVRDTSPLQFHTVEKYDENHQLAFGQAYDNFMSLKNRVALTPDEKQFITEIFLEKAQTFSIDILLANWVKSANTLKQFQTPATVRQQPSQAGEALNNYQSVLHSLDEALKNGHDPATRLKLKRFKAAYTVKPLASIGASMAHRMWQPTRESATSQTMPSRAVLAH